MTNGTIRTRLLALERELSPDEPDPGPLAGLAERIREGRLKVRERIKAGTYSPMTPEEALVRGRAMREALGRSWGVRR
jgi:hypothetical protein